MDVGKQSRTPTQVGWANPGHSGRHRDTGPLIFVSCNCASPNGRKVVYLACPLCPLHKRSCAILWGESSTILCLKNAVVSVVTRSRPALAQQSRRQLNSAARVGFHRVTLLCIVGSC